jgi:hypothetical protein
MVVAAIGLQNMEPDLQGKDAALRSQITEARARLEQLLSSEERVLSVFKLLIQFSELASLREIRRKHPCRYGLVQFTQDGKAIVALPKSATAADFLHAFAHTIVRSLPADTLRTCKQCLNSSSNDAEADFEELFACALERFYWDDAPGDRSPDREPVRKALREVYPAPAGTRIDVNVSPRLRDLFSRWCRENPPNYSGDGTACMPQPLGDPAAIGLNSNQPNKAIARRASAVSVPWQLLCACTLATLVGLFKLPYGYYIILRAAICIAAAFGFSLALQRRSDKWMWIYGAAAVLYNPVFPVRLGDKGFWVILNFTTIGVFWLAFARKGPRFTPGANP